MKTMLCGLAVLCLVPGMLQAGIANGTANFVLGQPDFSSSYPSINGLNKPRSVAIDPVRDCIFVADTNNNRVLWWTNATALLPRRPPSGVLGQADLQSVMANRGGAAQAYTLSRPFAVAVDPEGNLWVADYDNNRVLRYRPPFRNGMAADLVLGQAGFSDGSAKATAANTLHHPNGLSFDPAGNLWVSDLDNHRVVRFSRPFAGGQSADLVLGQQSFAWGKCNDSNGDGITDAVSADNFHAPEGICADPRGSVWVADHLNHRFIRFDPPFRSGMNASCVLGQPDLMHTSQKCSSAVSDRTVPCAFGIFVSTRTGDVWAVDNANNRILRFPGDGLASGMSAAQVIGQPDFSSRNINRGCPYPFSDRLYMPSCVAEDAAGNLWVAEQGNNRVLRFDAMKVLSFDATRAPNTGPKKFVISGSGMPEGTTIRLVREGRPDIAGTNVIMSGESQIRCTFDLTGAAGGTWDAVVEYNGMSARLPAALEVMAVRLGSVSTAGGFTAGPVSVTLAGENFYDGIVPALRQAGQPDIAGQYVTVTSSTRLTCRFDLSDAVTGYWNVTLPPADGNATLANAFQVSFPSSVVRAISRNRAYRLGIETPRGIVTLDIPAGAFAEDCVLSLFEPPAPPGPDPGEFVCSAVAAEIVNDKHLQPQKDITLTFYYNLDCVAGLDQRRLIVSSCDRPANRWLQAYSFADANAKRVTGKVRHLSLFRVVQRTARAALSDSPAAVYPNPYRPGTGGPYDNSTLGPGIVFGNLTPRADIRIFALTGEQVIELHEMSGSGVFLWDTKNEKGEKVAPGVYLYIITNPDDRSQKRKGMVSIIR